MNSIAHRLLSFWFWNGSSICGTAVTLVDMDALAVSSQTVRDNMTIRNALLNADTS